MKVVAIIQARMGSTRLPDKVMVEICGKTVLEHVITRVRHATEIDEVVIATTIKENDDIIAKEAEKLEVKYFRGSEEDVLSRYYYAAEENSADIIVRITSDCPLIDPKIIDKMIKQYKRLLKYNKVDYLSNTLKRTFPRGLDIEVFSFISLKENFNSATKPYQREHVTPYIYENKMKFNIVDYKNDVDYSSHRWTLDTREDLELVQVIYSELYEEGSFFYFEDIIKLFRFKPEYKQINSTIKQKMFKE